GGRPGGGRRAGGRGRGRGGGAGGGRGRRRGCRARRRRGRGRRRSGGGGGRRRRRRSRADLQRSVHVGVDLAVVRDRPALVERLGERAVGADGSGVERPVVGGHGVGEAVVVRPLHLRPDRGRERVGREAEVRDRGV